MSRLEGIRSTLSRGESSYNLINGVNVSKSAEDFPERVQSFLDLLFHFAHQRLDKFRNYVGLHDWKFKKVLSQYKTMRFENRRDNRFTKKALATNQQQPTFHGGKPQLPDIIAYNEGFLRMHNLPS